MPDQIDFERKLGAAVKDFAANADAALEPSVVAASALGARRAGWRIGRPATGLLRFVAVGVVVVVAVGVALGLSGNRPDIGATPTSSQPGASASASPETPTPTPTPTPTLTAEPTAVPTPTLALIAWTIHSGAEDWPAPPRIELSGAGVETTESISSLWRSFSDTTGDATPAAVDISSIHIGLGCVGGMPKIRCLELSLAGGMEDPLPLPEDAWYGFGIVLDVDSDGVPDYRYGIDNSDPGVGPIDGSCNCRVRGRVWRADLRTGEIEVVAISQATDDSFLGELPGTDGFPAMFHFKGVGGLFYAWSSLIQDGHVVATDYAPNVGWLELVNQ